VGRARLRRRSPAYPTDSTLDQLYDCAEFDAYRELGARSVELAIKQSMSSRSSEANAAGTR
jgi:hypothetical protein